MKTFVFFIFICSFLQGDLTIQEIFTEEYHWPLNEKLSPLTLTSQSQWQDWIDQNQILTVLDAGCGENPWIPHADYVGIDIVDAIIHCNQEKYGVEKIAFRKLDITEDLLPSVDLIFCKDTLHFFSFHDIASSIDKFKQSNSVYLILDTYAKLLENKETSSGIYRKVNFQAFPFFFPDPLLFIEDSEERFFGVWKLSEIDLQEFEKRVFPPMTLLTKPVGGSFRGEHGEVANSARRGLKKIRCDFTNNPDDLNEVKENVVVLCDERAGRQAYEWKNNHKIKTLLVGPIFVPSSENYFISWPLVDCYLSPSEWPALNLCRERPSLTDRVQIWYAGIDEQYWKPTIRFKDKQSKKVLLYCKTNSEIAEQAKRCLEEFGYIPEEIVWGKYKHDGYKKMLEECKFAVFVSRSETQGIALAEAWAMDVPVLAWNPQTSFDWDNIIWMPVSSCPYMNPIVGLDWKEMDQFRSILRNFEEQAERFQPRRWVLMNMTDKISVERLMSHMRKYQ